MQERMYRVWVEKHESGWVQVTARTADLARDRAQAIASGHWYPESSQVSALRADPLPAPPETP